MEERDFGKDVMESDLGAEERDLGAGKGGFGADKGGFDTEEKSFGLDENDLKGSGTRCEAGLLMHSQHLQMQTSTYKICTETNCSQHSYSCYSSTWEILTYWSFTLKRNP